MCVNNPSKTQVQENDFFLPQDLIYGELNSGIKFRMYHLKMLVLQQETANSVIKT